MAQATGYRQGETIRGNPNHRLFSPLRSGQVGNGDNVQSPKHLSVVTESCSSINNDDICADHGKSSCWTPRRLPLESRLLTVEAIGQPFPNPAQYTPSTMFFS